MAKSVLIVSYTFPPTGGAGVQRVSKFVKYLRDFGWEPVVLTAANPSVPLSDPSLLDDVPPGVAIHKAATLEPSYTAKQGGGGQGRRSLKSRLLRGAKGAMRHLLLPDAQLLWWPGLVKSLAAVLETGNIRCMFVTSPPYSVLIPSVYLAKKYNVPVVLDFRDEWSFSRNQWENASRNRFAHFVDCFFERYVLMNCSMFTAATQSYVTSILDRYPSLVRNRGKAITNGYDEDDLVQVGSAREGEGVTFLYAGTVWSATTLRPFMTALDRLVSEEPHLAQTLLVRVVGRVVEAEVDAFSGPAASRVQLTGYLEHREVMSELARADVLILTLTDLPGAERIIPGKAFEYMATGKHILAIVPDGETKRLVARKYRNSTISASCTAEEIGRSLRQVIANIASIREQSGDVPTEFSRRALTGELAQVLDRAASEGGRPLT